MKLNSDTFTADEFCATVQALRIALCQRLYWMLSPLHPIRGGPFDNELAVFSHIVNAYSKAMMIARDSELIAPEFKEYFMLSDDAYTMIDQIEKAESWDGVPAHRHNSPLSCKLCEELITAV